MMRMYCPKCDAELQMTNKHGITIKHCPICHGKWFDQGELERLLKRISVLEHHRVVPSEDPLGNYRTL
jgi:Zn-finger nucleic acid-binding protein